MPLLQTVAQFAGLAAVSGLWQGAALAAAAWLCLRLVPHVTAALRFALWTAVLLLIPLLSLLQGGAKPTAPRALVHADPRWSLALAALWLLFSALRGCSLVLHSVQLWILHRAATPVASPEPLRPLLTLPYRRVQLCTSSRLDRPGVIGFFAPRILIPGWLYPQLSVAELEQIVLHEVEHLRRGDDWLNLLQKLALVLFPLNPILIGIESLLCRERELACDDAVLRRTRSPRAYAATLAALAERDLNHRDFAPRSLAQRGLSLALGALGALKQNAPQSELARRVYRILRGEAASSPLHAQALSAAVGLLLLGGATGLARCPQLVSFTAATQPLPAAVAQTLESLPIQTRPVLYTDAQASAPRLLGASLSLKPVPAKSKAAKRKPVKHWTEPIAQTHAVLQRNETVHDAVFVPATWTEADRARLMSFTAHLPLTGSYAAVRVEGGWLLLKL